MALGLLECEIAGRRWRDLPLRMRQTVLPRSKTAMGLEA